MNSSDASGTRFRVNVFRVLGLLAISCGLLLLVLGIRMVARGDGLPWLNPIQAALGLGLGVALFLAARKVREEFADPRPEGPPPER